MINSVFYIRLICSLLLLAYSISNVSSNEAQYLYTSKCSACHGSEGDGGVGVPLALADFQATVSNEYLRKTIRFGRPGRVMPSFKQLSDREVNKIIYYIRSFTQVKVPMENTNKIIADSKKGKILFQQYCENCHGKNGVGKKGTGVTFSRPRNSAIIAPALNNQGFLKSASDFMIKQTLIQGRRNTAMKSFKSQGLSETDIDNLVSYIRSFEKNKSAIKQSKLKPIIKYESPYSLTETIESLKRAAIGKNFKIIRVQSLDNGFVTNDQENIKQTIIYFCNFSILNDSLKIDPRIGMFLPCRVTVVEHKGKISVMAINPLRLSKLFNNSELDSSCIKMRDIYIDIIEEALL